MADLGDELEFVGGGGRLGSALRASRYWPAAASAFMVPGTLTGHPVAAVVLVVGLAGVGLTVFAEKKLEAAP